MLTAESYFIATTIYLLAGFFTVFFAYHWLGGFLSLRWQRVLSAAALALLLTPAPATIGAETLAPAFIVGVFDLLFNGGWQVAQPALLNLGAALLLAVSAALWLSRDYKAPKKSDMNKTQVS